jgi:ATP-dependent RNA helicase SUPV3L1/SUV3
MYRSALSLSRRYFHKSPGIKCARSNKYFLGTTCHQSNYSLGKTKQILISIRPFSTNPDSNKNEDELSEGAVDEFQAEYEEDSEDLKRLSSRELRYFLRSAQFKGTLFDLDSSMTEALYRSNINPFIDYVRSAENSELSLALSFSLKQIKEAGKSAPAAQEIQFLAQSFLVFLDESIDEQQQKEPAPSRPSTASSRKEALYKLVEKEKIIDPSPERTSLSPRLRRNRDGSLRYDPQLDILASLHQPHENYAAARSIKRKIIVHVGPTNSGKTYRALQRLIEAESGAYAGPLRLLAWEVHETVTKAGVHCNLLTGQESIHEIGAQHTSSTVEMVDTSTIVDVAVIDEMQMIGAADRGSAWTRALLGVPARELHVCGDPTMIKIVEELCAITGENFAVNEYKRLTPLQFSAPLRAGLKEIRRGDCVIAFRRRDLYTIKRQIELKTGLKCCIIYGSLPPETRKLQAELFNSPDSGYDVLVASDAVGMGLNLNIGRIIFSSIKKFDGESERELEPRELLQIGGRAGRFRSEFSIGLVTTLHAADYSIMKRIMGQKLRPIKKAGLQPSLEQIDALARSKPKETLSNILNYLQGFSKIDNIYFLCNMQSMLDIAKTIESFDLTLEERYSFSLAPANVEKPAQKVAIMNFARDFASLRQVSLNSLLSKLKILQKNHFSSAGEISLLEEIYAQLDIYAWLARKFNGEEEIFVDLPKALDLRALAGEKIAHALADMHPSEHKLNYTKKLLEKHKELEEKSRERRLELAKFATATEFDRNLEGKIEEIPRKQQAALLRANNAIGHSDLPE